MATVKGPQLSTIQRLYGLSPAQLLGVTDIDTDHVSQVLPIAPEILRRSNSILGSVAGGFFQATLENVHSAADDEVTVLRPYASAAAAITVPTPVPDGWDIWLLGGSVLRTAGAGGAAMVIALNGIPGGMGLDDGGTQVTDTPLQILGRWDSIIDDIQAFLGYGATEAGDPWINFNVRLPRGVVIEFHSTSDAAITIQAALQMGIFPEGMGQDVVT